MDAVKSSSSALTHTAELHTADRLYRFTTTRGRVHCNHKDTCTGFNGYRKTKFCVIFEKYTIVALGKNVLHLLQQGAQKCGLV